MPAEPLEEARRLLGFTSKTDTVIILLQELVRRWRIDELKQMLGYVRPDLDVASSRRRREPVAAAARDRRRHVGLDRGVPAWRTWLMAAIATAHGVAIGSLDGDFRRMARPGTVTVERAG